MLFLLLLLLAYVNLSPSAPPMLDFDNNSSIVKNPTAPELYNDNNNNNNNNNNNIFIFLFLLLMLLLVVFVVDVIIIIIIIIIRPIVEASYVKIEPNNNINNNEYGTFKHLIAQLSQVILLSLLLNL